LKPKLLFLAPQNPYPPNDGGKLSIYFPVKYLRNHFEVHFVTPVSRIDDKVSNAVSHFRELGVKYHPVVKDTNDKVSDLIGNVFKRVPFKWLKYYSDDIYKLCEELVLKEDIKYIFTSAPHMALYSVKLKELIPRLKIFLREHNIEFSLVEQFVNTTKNPIYKAIGIWQLSKAKSLEQEYWELFDKVFFISDYDYEMAKRLRPDLATKFSVLYDGFEVGRICETREFKGTFIIPSNIRAQQNHVNLRWFIREIWIPSLHYIKQNNFVLSITSGSQREWEKILGIHNLEQYNVRFLGFVEDINDELCRHKYVISPTVMGSGLRIKILQSMAAGKVVLATGYDVKTTKVFKDMYNIVEFNSSDEFVKKVRTIEQQLALYETVRKNALKTIREHFNWSYYAQVIFENFERKYS